MCVVFVGYGCRHDELKPSSAPPPLCRIYLIWLPATTNRTVEPRRYASCRSDDCIRPTYSRTAAAARPRFDRHRSNTHRPTASPPPPPPRRCATSSRRSRSRSRSAARLSAARGAAASAAAPRRPRRMTSGACRREATRSRRSARGARIARPRTTTAPWTARSCSRCRRRVARGDANRRLSPPRHHHGEGHAAIRRPAHALSRSGRGAHVRGSRRVFADRENNRAILPR